MGVPRGGGDSSSGSENQAQCNKSGKEAEGNMSVIDRASSFRDYTLSTGLHDNGWHHLCLTWRNTDGKACLFVDGIKLTCVTNYQTGQTIAANGKFILGQEQDSLGTVADGFICY